jgi:hypothetical protein
MDEAGESVDHERREERPFALDVIRDWPDTARQAAYGVILVHGAPDVLDERALRWDHLGPWKRVVVCADDGDGVVESVIDATVADEHRSDVASVEEEFGVAVEDDGELSVRGRDLQVNVVTLNVLHAFISGEVTLDEARERRTRDLADLRDGKPPADAGEIHFADDAPHGEPRTRPPLGDAPPPTA